MSLEENTAPAVAPDTSAIQRVRIPPIDGYWSYVRIVYTGMAEDLLACGAIEPGMEARAPKRGRRLDSRGDRFVRDPCPNGRLRIMRFVTSVEGALALPGVTRENLNPDVLALHASPSRLIVREDSWRIYCIGKREILEAAGLPVIDEYVRGRPRPCPVMGGFFALTIEKPNSDPETDTHILGVALKLVARAGRAHLRLVVDNTRGEPS